MQPHKRPAAETANIGSLFAITEPEVIAQVGNVYREVWLERMGAQPGPDETPAYRSARYLANHMPEVPAMIMACVDHDQGYVPRTPRSTHR